MDKPKYYRVCWKSNDTGICDSTRWIEEKNFNHGIDIKTFDVVYPGEYHWYERTDYLVLSGVEREDIHSNLIRV